MPGLNDDFSPPGNTHFKFPRQIRQWHPQLSDSPVAEKTPFLNFPILAALGKNLMQFHFILKRFWKSCPLRRCLLLKLMTYPVKSLLINFDNGTIPVLNRKWAWMERNATRNSLSGSPEAAFPADPKSPRGLCYYEIFFAALSLGSSRDEKRPKRQGVLIFA